MTKFIVPAKFSSCLMCTDSSNPSAPSISAPAASAASACRPAHDSTGRSVPISTATITKASACSTESSAVAHSLENSNQGRGSGAVSSSRISPISRSYTIASDDCMPLNSNTMPTSPGTMYTS